VQNGGLGGGILQTLYMEGLGEVWGRSCRSWKPTCIRRVDHASVNLFNFMRVVRN